MSLLEQTGESGRSRLYFVIRSLVPLAAKSGRSIARAQHTYDRLFADLIENRELHPALLNVYDTRGSRKAWTSKAGFFLDFVLDLMVELAITFIKHRLSEMLAASRDSEQATRMARRGESVAQG